MLFDNYLRAQPLFTQLSRTYQSVEGNLLERGDALTIEAQIEALRWAIHLAEPRNILETGTNKSMFGFFLSHVLPRATLYTFDGDPCCAAGVELMNGAQSAVQSIFTLGDTKQTLVLFHGVAIGFAWIDGGHDQSTAFSDIKRAMDLRVPLIAVDDTKAMPQVAKAVERAILDCPEYAQLSNPFWQHDARGISFIHAR
jgi:hypothetical protein